MKLKHWQGYGTVNAKKISKTEKNGVTTLKIRVTGNHECGIERNDKYDVKNWLVKRFDKSFDDKKCIIDLTLIPSSEDGVDVCDYIITY